MRKLALVLLVAMFIPASVYSEPRHHWWKEKKTYVLAAVVVGAALYRTRSISACRARNNLQHCPDGGYGPYQEREAIAWGTGFGMLALSVYGNQHWRSGWKNALINDAPVALISGWNVAVGVSNQRVPTYPKQDMLRLIPARR